MPDPAPPADFDQLAAQLRPRLHRYCARMTGSALDGEDAVQEALLKAALGFDAEAVRNPEGWLFRIAHNAAMDLLRRRARDQALFVDEMDADALPAAAEADPGTAALALRVFMRLPPAQRGAVILADVLEHALQECADILGMSLAAAKAALHRGRMRLRELAPLAGQAPAQHLSPEDQQLLARYAGHFNARDFDGLRALLGEDVRLDLAGRRRDTGRAIVSAYYGNYAKLPVPVRAEPGVLEGRPALWIFEPGSAAPAYVVVLQGTPDRVEAIRDFRYARYVMDSVDSGSAESSCSSSASWLPAASSSARPLSAVAAAALPAAPCGL